MRSYENESYRSSIFQRNVVKSVPFPTPVGSENSRVGVKFINSFYFKYYFESQFFSNSNKSSLREQRHLSCRCSMWNVQHPTYNYSNKKNHILNPLAPFTVICSLYWLIHLGPFCSLNHHCYLNKCCGRLFQNCFPLVFSICLSVLSQLYLVFSAYSSTGCRRDDSPDIYETLVCY